MVIIKRIISVINITEIIEVSNIIFHALPLSLLFPTCLHLVI
jgi:hypothetical protein